jgi:hypothetical protein
MSNKFKPSLIEYVVQNPFLADLFRYSDYWRKRQVESDNKKQIHHIVYLRSHSKCPSCGWYSC